jgi:Response regulators consisting of a CheY-like receiver domain and a winged-helix DNA-binding domain
VLVADDEASFRLLVGIWLSASGYDVVEAVDGADALHAVEAHGLPDAAVLDVHMPRVDGLAVCRSLRARSVRLPILIVSSLEDVEEAAYVAGADFVLPKTAEREELCAALGAARACGVRSIGRVQAVS